VVNAASKILDELICKHEKKLKAEESSIEPKRNEIRNDISVSLFGELTRRGSSSDFYEGSGAAVILGKERGATLIQPRLEQIREKLRTVSNLNAGKREQKGIKWFLLIHRDFFKAVYTTLLLVDQ